MVDMGTNSALTLLQLRDVVLARAEEDVSREIILRLPPAERNIATLTADARSETPTASVVQSPSPPPALSLLSIQTTPGS